MNPHLSDLNISAWRDYCRNSWKHYDVIKWKHFPRYWTFVRGIHRSPVNSPAQRPVTRSFDIFFDLRLIKWLSKQSWGSWFDTPSRLLWRHRNDIMTWRTSATRVNIQLLYVFYYETLNFCDIPCYVIQTVIWNHPGNQRKFQENIFPYWTLGNKFQWY